MYCFLKIVLPLVLVFRMNAGSIVFYEHSSNLNLSEIKKNRISDLKDQPYTLKLSNDTLKFPVNFTNSNLQYKIINENDLSEVELKPVNGSYFYKLKNNQNYVIVLTKDGNLFNKIYLSLSKDSLSNNISIKFRSINEPIEFEEFFSLAFFNTSPVAGSCTVQFSSEEIASEPIHLEVNTANFFKYTELLEPAKYYCFSSKIFNP